MMKKASVIIQARMGSSRLPNKVLMPLAGKPVLEHVIRRCQSASLVDRVLVATTVDPKDQSIVDFVDGLGVSVYKGSVNDVLDRYYQAARLFEFKDIVRITADCPMIDPKVIDQVIALHFKENADYTANIIKETFPDGEDVEVFSFSALKLAWEKAKMVSEREHVTPYLKNNPALFKAVNLSCEKDLSNLRWTLDEQADYEFIKAIYEGLATKGDDFGMKDILNHLDDHPELLKINRHIGRNEGYLRNG